MLNGHDFSLGILCLDFNLYHSFVVDTKESIFLFVGVRGGSVEYHALLFMKKNSFMTCTGRKLDRGFISIFCYIDSHYVQKANEPIEQGERCAY